MNRNEALQHGLGYAAGREDVSGTETKTSANPEDSWRSGFTAFAVAFADGWDAYEKQERGWMTNAEDAYDVWQESNGRTIFNDEWRDIKRASGNNVTAPAPDPNPADNVICTVKDCPGYSTPHPPIRR